ncbi:MAG TPA: hypothetical protein VL546_08485, partial [Steroidobacteraceae bacterium]|nr:hypothetical protein [Steroidobacteraceae bacterium]
MGFASIVIDSAKHRALGYPLIYSHFPLLLFARVAGSGFQQERAQARGQTMAEARRMGKSELFSHFADRF